MKAEIKQKRKELLARIDRLELNRCKVCKSAAINPKSTKCQCQAAVEIRDLGKQLDELTNPAKAINHPIEPKLGKGEDRKRYSKEMIALALSNGIGYKMFQQRVKQYGWSEERAATEIPFRRMRNANK